MILAHCFTFLEFADETFMLSIQSSIPIYFDKVESELAAEKWDYNNYIVWAGQDLIWLRRVA